MTYSGGGEGRQRSREVERGQEAADPAVELVRVVELQAQHLPRVITTRVKGLLTE